MYFVFSKKELNYIAKILSTEVYIVIITDIKDKSGSYEIVLVVNELPSQDGYMEQGIN